MRLHLWVALLLLAAATSGAEVPVGNPPMIGGSLDGLLYDGSHFLLLQRGVRTTLADDGTPLASANDGDRVALASSGRGVLSLSISNGSAYANGTLLGPASAAAAAWDGTRYIAALRDGQRLALAFLSESGAVSGRIDVAGDAGAFALAARDGVALVVWSSGNALFARTTTGAAAGIGDGVLSDVAAGKEGFMVTTLSGGNVVARHVDRAGHPDATYTVGTGTGGAHVARERYAYDLAWPDGNRLLGARVDPIAGDMHGPFVIAMLDQPIDRVAVATTTATTLVAYSSAGIFAKQIDDTTPGKPMHAHLARQSEVHAADGLVAWQQETDEIRVNDVVVAHGELLDVAAGGGITLIVWRDAAGLWSLLYPIDATPRPATAARAVWDGAQFVMFDSTASIASNGSEFLAVWNDNGEIVAQHVGRNDRIVVGSGSGTPHVRWDGAAWVVTWPEIVDAATAGFASVRIGGPKTYVARAPLPISLTDWSDTAQAVYYVRDGRLFMQRIDAARRRAAGR